ncbi:DgyrCDS5601 [Dimorphilus gyrociliatus]|uniref:DgyrCDS5601 n=1 Tax=Dimorphilus gyrociliatus TaxID=2664684 RepID=A0A7I8VM11_9ANNE|nr:DgyrCDS5601 [Dimorphilus gyrociliatus]
MDRHQESILFSKRLPEMMGKLQDFKILLPIVTNEFGKFVYDNKSWTDTQEVAINRYLETNNNTTNNSNDICLYAKLSVKRRKPLWILVENCQKKTFNSICYRPLRGDWSPWNRWTLTDKCPTNVCSRKLEKTMIRTRRCNEPRPKSIEKLPLKRNIKEFHLQRKSFRCLGEDTQYHYAAAEKYSLLVRRWKADVFKIQNVARVCVSSLYLETNQQYFGGILTPEDKDSFIINDKRNSIS